MKNHISFCVNNSKRLTFCFVNELQDVLRFLSVFFLYALPFYFYSFLLLPGGGVPRPSGTPPPRKRGIEILYLYLYDLFYQLLYNTACHRIRSYIVFIFRFCHK